MNMDITKPPTEVELAEALIRADASVRDIVRRLAFQRDRLTRERDEARFDANVAREEAALADNEYRLVLAELDRLRELLTKAHGRIDHETHCAVRRGCCTCGAAILMAEIDAALAEKTP